MSYRVLLFGALILALQLAVTGCGSTASQSSSGNSQANVAGTQPTKENPIVIDKTNGTILFLAEVNGKYFYEPTRHGVVYKGGSNGEKAIFRGLVDPKSFHDDLVAIGAKAGENMTMKNKEMTHVQGDALDVKVTWQGAAKDYDINEVIKDSTGKPIIMQFGGNLKNSLDKKTGCLLCLDSCPVGIASNTTYTYGAVEKRKEVAFTGNKDVLPQDGTLVIFKIKIRK